MFASHYQLDTNSFILTTGAVLSSDGSEMTFSILCNVESKAGQQSLTGDELVNVEKKKKNRDKPLH